MFSIHFVHLAMAQFNHTKTKSGFLAQNRTRFTSLITYVSVLFLVNRVKKADPPPKTLVAYLSSYFIPLHSPLPLLTPIELLALGLLSLSFTGCLTD